MSERLSRYEVSPADRIRAILGESPICETDELEYSFSEGYERLTITHAGGGGMEYRGSYHPNVVCEGGGICKWCGCTLGPFAS